MRKKWILITIIISLILIISFATAPTFWADLNMMGYDIYNATWINASTFNGTYYGNGFNLIFSEIYLASNITTVDGTYDSGDLDSIQTSEDADSYNVTEDAGADPLTVQINFTGVTTFDSIVTRVYYSGGLGHEIQFEIWRTDTKVWENYFEITDMNDFNNIYVPVLDPELHIDINGNVTVRFHHVQNGVPFHEFAIDYIILIRGLTVITAIEHDALGGRDNKANHPWAFPTDASRNITGNINAPNYNITVNATKIGDGGICWNGTGIIITGNFSKYCG